MFLGRRLQAHTTHTFGFLFAGRGERLALSSPSESAWHNVFQTAEMFLERDTFHGAETDSCFVHSILE